MIPRRRANNHSPLQVVTSRDGLVRWWSRRGLGDARQDRGRRERRSDPPNSRHDRPERTL